MWFFGRVFAKCLQYVAFWPLPLSSSSLAAAISCPSSLQLQLFHLHKVSVSSCACQCVRTQVWPADSTAHRLHNSVLSQSGAQALLKTDCHMLASLLMWCAGRMSVLWCLDVVIIHRFSWCVTVMEEENHHSLKHSSFALSALWDLFPDGLHTDVSWQLAFTPWGVDGGWQTGKHFKHLYTYIPPVMGTVMPGKY